MNNLMDSLLAFQAKQIEQVPCETCNQLHVPIPNLSVSTKYSGPMYFCSDRCLDEWVQWGRYQ